MVRSDCQIILLYGGIETKVSPEDYDSLIQHRWRLNPDGYAIRTEKKSLKTVRMHRQILNAQPGQEVDHVDGDTLNNQRSNIRICTRAENLRNRGRFKSSRSQYKGVWLAKEIGSVDKPWRAQIKVPGGKVRYLGSFRTEIEAAAAYDYAACDLFGEFAKLNSG